MVITALVVLAVLIAVATVVFWRLTRPEATEPAMRWTGAPQEPTDATAPSATAPSATPTGSAPSATPTGAAPTGAAETPRPEVRTEQPRTAG